MDVADFASEREESFLAEALKIRKAGVSLRPNGHCHFCTGVVGPQAIFCDTDCQQDWERRQPRTPRVS